MGDQFRPLRILRLLVFGIWFKLRSGSRPDLSLLREFACSGASTAISQSTWCGLQQDHPSLDILANPSHSKCVRTIRSSLRVVVG